MKHNLIGSTTLIAILVAGCTSTPVSDSRLQVLPVERVQHSMTRAEAMYQTGRYFQGQVRYEQAISAYHKALEENPDHVDALNALGVALANVGRHADAEAAFKQAIALSPDAAYLYNNLGYAYLRSGRVEEGQTALAHAVDLAPDNARYAANFSEATASLAALRMARAALAQARRGGDSEDGALARAPNPRLEVSNGNGVRGMAARTAGLLRHFGLAATRLTNDRPFRQDQTEIQYLPGRESSAQQISDILPIAATLVELPAMQRGIEVRVLIGHDLPDGAIRRLLRSRADNAPRDEAQG